MLSRRDLFAVGSASLLTVGAARAEHRKLALRVTHITDVHITKDRDAPKGAAKMFAHMFGQKDWSPDIVLNTGDAVMNIDDAKATAKSAAEQISVWKEAVKNCKSPIYSCLGNHDYWSGTEPTDDVPATMKGAALMVKSLGMPDRHYSFDKGGWHFIALDSMSDWPKYGYLTKDHFDWLKADLKKTPKDTPVCVYSHLPILSITGMSYGVSCRKGNDNLIPGVWHHADCWAISEVFRRHPNVKLCLSGHMHTCDRCEYRGVWYICGGAASGAWWTGSEYGFPPMYGKINLYADGTFDYEFVDYGWTARGWKGKELAL
jgi:predicted MPP superfamily phosphohydrolase